MWRHSRISTWRHILTQNGETTDLHILCGRNSQLLLMTSLLNVAEKRSASVCQSPIRHVDNFVKKRSQVWRFFFWKLRYVAARCCTMFVCTIYMYRPPMKLLLFRPTIGTVRSLWTRLWGRYHVPQNVFLVEFICLSILLSLSLCSCRDR